MTGAAEALDGGTVRLTVDLDPGTFARAEEEGWFHLVARAGERGSPSDVPSYRLVLRLDDGLAADLPEAWRSAGAWHAEDVQRERAVPPGLAGPDAHLSSDVPVVPLVETARGWLEEKGFEPQLVDDSTILRLDGEGDNGSWVLWVETIEDEGVVRVFSSWPHEVPAERRQAVMELVTRTNPELTTGSVDLDLDRGQVSLRTTLDLGGEPLTAGLLEGLVRANVTAFDDFLPQLRATIDGAEAWISHSATEE